MNPLYDLKSTPQHVTGPAGFIRPAPGQDAIAIAGCDHSVRRVKIEGAMHGIKFDGGASDITVAEAIIRNPLPSGGGGYCIYSSNGKGTNERVDFINVVMEIDDKQQYAQFPARLYGVRDWRFINCTFINRTKALKASVKLGEGKNVEFRDCTLIGWPPGIGRNPNDPATYLCENVKFVRGTIDMNTPTTTGAPSLKIVWTSGISFEETTIIQRANVGVLDIGDGVDGLAFTKCKLSGGSGIGKKGNGAFPGSTYNGKAIA